MAETNSQNYPSIPSNYISIAQLQERWLKEKEKKQQEKEKQEKEKQEKKQSKTPFHQNHQRHQNHSMKGWREVGLISIEPKLKEVEITGRVVKEGEKNKKKGYFVNRKPRFERDGKEDMAKVSTFDVAEKEIMTMVSVENSEKEISKGKCKNKEDEEVAYVCRVEVVGESSVGREIAGQKCKVGFKGMKNSNVEQSRKERSAEEDEVLVDVKERTNEKERMGGAFRDEVLVDVKERTNEKERMRGAFRAYGDKEVEVVGESNGGREIGGEKCRVGFKGKKNGGRKWGDRVEEVSDKVDSAELSGKKRIVEKEEVLVDVKRRTNGKARMRGGFRAYGYKEVKEVATVCKMEVVEENNVDREIAGQKCRVGFRGKKNSARKMGDRVGEASDIADSSEQAGQENNAEKEDVSVGVKEKTNEKARIRGAFRAYGDKEVEAIGERNVDRELGGKRFKVGFREKKNSGRMMVDRVGEVDTVEQSGQKHSTEKEKVLVDVKERTNEKTRMRGTFCACGDKEVEEVPTICTVEVVEENKVDRGIAGQKCRVGFRRIKNSGRKMGDRVGEVSDKVDGVEQSGQEHNAEKEEVSVDMKERTNEKVRMRGAFRAYGDKEVEEVAMVCTMEVVGENEVDRENGGQKCRVGFKDKKSSWRKVDDKVGEVSDKMESLEQSGKQHNAEKDVPLIDSEAGLKMKIERDLGDLSLIDKSYGQRRSNVSAYGDKWRYGTSKRYEQRRTLKQKDNSFVWVKKGESSNG
ncbi:uncharacterized protein LOC132604061 [Lycium barbarum]|uniref:uncharacterized protein LOC132604061 n=1 Tax=Lycium barbarum TaxID=112863 RepID=UPI00293F204C|nr:uncharacterized protein LOC132604061 [Lycium barbarum]